MELILSVLGILNLLNQTLIFELSRMFARKKSFVYCSILTQTTFVYVGTSGKGTIFGAAGGDGSLPVWNLVGRRWSTNEYSRTAA